MESIAELCGYQHGLSPGHVSPTKRLPVPLAGLGCTTLVPLAWVRRMSAKALCAHNEPYTYPT